MKINKERDIDRLKQGGVESVGERFSLHWERSHKNTQITKCQERQRKW